MKTDNELIAEFMGLTHIDGQYQRMEDGGLFWYTPELFEYHTSWDWLMPVCIRLKFEYICTDINRAYEQVINEIKKRNMVGGARI